jgi:catechol 2,3-dioxygenase-like lactoylglutathione lyase family enzyme
MSDAFSAVLQPEANVQQVVPFNAVSNMKASLKFYVDGLGFTITHKWEPEGGIRWCALRLGGASIMLQEHYPAKVAEGEMGKGTMPHFVCRDALALYREFVARDVPTPQEPFVSNGMWFFAVTDPDGYRMAFESRTTVREGTTMSEHEWSQS